MVLPFDGECYWNYLNVTTDCFREQALPYVGSPFLNPSPRALIGLTVCPLAGSVTELLARRTIDNEAVVALRKRLTAVYAEHGWGEYRSSIGFMDAAAASFDFNYGAQRRLHERLKDALDPNGVLMPGKYGIWPRDRRR